MKRDSALSVAINIFTAPAEAFASIREQPRFLFPLLLVIVATTATSGAYISEVDIAWSTEQQLRALSFVEMSESQLDEAIETTVARGRTPLLLQSIIGTALFVPIVFLLQALYLKLVSAIAKDGVNYRRWFSLACWTALPVILDQIASLVFIAGNNIAFVAQSELNPLSFGNLLGLDPDGASALQRIGMSLSPINAWPVILGILGVKFLSGKGILYASAVVLAPLALIFAGALALI